MKKVYLVSVLVDANQKPIDSSRILRIEFVYVNHKPLQVGKIVDAMSVVDATVFAKLEAVVDHQLITVFAFLFTVFWVVA